MRHITHSLIYSKAHPRDQQSLPTRRSSDLSTSGATARATNSSESSPRRASSPSSAHLAAASLRSCAPGCCPTSSADSCRSEEHTSELQSHVNLVCRLLLEKKKLCYSSSTRH